MRRVGIGVSSFSHTAPIALVLASYDMRFSVALVDVKIHADYMLFEEYT